MDHRAVLALAMLSGAVLLGSTFSCSAADPGTINFSERPKGQTGDLTSGGTSGVTPTDGGSSGDAGEAGADGGGSTSGALVTAFTGAAAYNAAGASVGSSQNAAHPNGGNPAGVDCMTCHGAAGAAGSKWGIAGTIYNTVAGAAPVAKAEVRVVDAAGKQVALVYSDALGNFWADTIVGGVTGGSKVGARNATATKLMGLALTTQDAGCQRSTCHVAGSQGRVFLQ